MDPVRDFDPKGPLCAEAATLNADLSLSVLLETMACGDKARHEVCTHALLAESPCDAELAHYRQAVLRDCLVRNGLAGELHSIAAAATAAERGIYHGIFSQYPQAVVRRSAEVLAAFVPFFRQLRALADEHAPHVTSQGWTQFFTTLREQLNEAFFDEVATHLRFLRDTDDLLLSARLDAYNRGCDHALRKRSTETQNWWHRWLRRWTEARRDAPFTFCIPFRDEAGFRALSELRGRGYASLAVSLSEAAEHVLGFFRCLEAETSFYLGALALRSALHAVGMNTCWPVPLPIGAGALACRNLYDPSLALRSLESVVGNELDADGKTLILITGANQGGKSTFLRALGLAQLMMHSGLFVPASSFAASIAPAIFTHFKREEDRGLRRGKLDEELARMARIVPQLSPHALLLMNESFSATNEREGSEISLEIVRALAEQAVRIVSVTHLHAFARAIDASALTIAMFLRAERREDGSRSFKLHPGPPLPTSYGQDLYRRIFGAHAAQQREVSCAEETT